MKRVAFYTLGCKLNFSETSTITRMFEEKGFLKVDFTDKPDIFVINTCSVTENADKKCKKIVKEAIANGMSQGVVLNVNIPKLSENKIKGIKVCRQARANWKEKFDKRTNPMGKDYYWLTGEFELLDKGEDTDEWALANGYISIVPTQFDLTAHHAIQHINNWNLHA